MTKKKKIAKGKLIGLEKITEFMKIVFASGYVENEKPISTIMQAPYGSGKTTTVKQFRGNGNIKILTDVTAYGILSKYQNELRTRTITHIIMPDLLNALSRRKTTVETLLLFINASSEDGIFPSETYNIKVNEYIPPFGWILCITDDAYERKKRFLHEVGLENRFFIVHHKYSVETVNKILSEIINEDQYTIPDLKLKPYRKKKFIKGNKAIFEELVAYSKLLCKDPRNEAEVLRIQRLLQAFLKSSALLRGDNQVRKDDLDKFKDLIELLR